MRRLNLRSIVPLKGIVYIIFCGFFFLPSLSVRGGPIEDLQPGHWYKVPNSRLDQSGVFPPSPTPEGTPAYIVDAWSGGAYDTKRNRFMIWGGGHGDYAGNEIYAFDMSTLTWSRIWGPTQAYPGGGSCYETYADGSPSSRHTYDGMVYLPTQDKLFGSGGSLWCGSGGSSKATWMFNLSTSTWERKTDAPWTTGVSVHSDYYSVTGQVIEENSEHEGIYDYNPSTNAWSLRKTLSGVPHGTDMSGAIDPVNRLFVVTGQGYIHVLNLDTNTIIQPTTTGDRSVQNSRGPGLVYDPVLKKIVGWPGGMWPSNGRATYGDTAVYSLNTTTWAWTKHTAAPTNTVTPTGATRVGVFGRFQYIPSKNAYILMNATKEEVYIYKLSSGTPTPPGQINIPNKTWVARNAPVTYTNGPCPGANCKHMRLAHNPIDGLIYFLGGDYSGGSYNDTGRMEVWAYSILSDTWTKKHDYCGPVGSFQPANPDQVGWAWDSTRKKFWMVPGYQADPTGICSGVNFSRWKMATFNYETGVWTDETARSMSAGTGEDRSFIQYDAVSDTFIRFYWTGGVPAAQIYNLSSNSWSQVNFTGNARFGMEYSALDPVTRRIYLIDWNEGKLYRYDIAKQTLTYLTTTPASTGENSAMPIWDSVNSVLLWPRIASFSNATITLYIYHPDTNTWETDNMYQPEGYTVKGNNAVFNPQQNVLFLMGDRTNPNGKFFLYRYGNGSDQSPTPPTQLKIQ